MSRTHLQLIFLFLILLLPHIDISQTIRDSNAKLVVKITGGEFRDNYSRKIGSISSDGVVRNSSYKKLGAIQNGKVVNENSMTIFKYDGSGTIRNKNGILIYRIGSNGDIRNSSGQLLFKHENIELIYLIGYLCFFRGII